MLEGPYMTPGNSYTYASFVDNGLLIVSRGHELFSFSIEGPAENS